MNSSNTGTSSPKRQYAAGTTVGIGRTKDEINRELERLGAVKRMLPEDDEQRLAAVVFGVRNPAGLLVQYRIMMPLADPYEHRFHFTPGRNLRRSVPDARTAYRQDCDERWRALGAYIKAMRLAVEAGISTTEQVLSSYVVLPNGQTSGEYMAEALPEIYASGQMPETLPGLPGPRYFAPQLPAPSDEVIGDADAKRQ